MSAKDEDTKDTANEDMEKIQNGGVREWYSGKTILITGATGFMGKVLVEKLLRSCPNIKKIYLLMRPKRGCDVTTRFNEYLKHVIFERVRSARPSCSTQLHPISGDVMSPALGINPSDRALLLDTVQVVFHCAANVRFDMTLKPAVLMNTGGSLKMLQLAEDMKQLEVFLHVSTSYCHCDEDVLEEKSYKPRMNPRELLGALEWMDDTCLESITPHLLGNLPNTYAFSKNLTEGLIQEYSSKFPIGISRPSIVISSWKEPLAGFVDNQNGPVGLLVAAGKGVLRSMHCKPNYYADVIPVDFAINTIIGQAWMIGSGSAPPTSPWIVHACVNSNQVTWSDVIERGRKHLYENPFSQCIWYPDGSIKNSRVAHEFSVIFFHFLPAYIIDMLLRLCGQKTFMVNIQRRIQGGLHLLQYYTTKQWRFRTDNVQTISDAMSVDERQIFYTDMGIIDWEQFFEAYVLGTRQYCLKEDPATLPKARRHIRRLYWLDQLVSWLFYALLIYFVFIYFPSMKDFTEKSMAVFAPFLNHTNMSSFTLSIYNSI